MQALLWDPERGIRVGGVSATCVRPEESGILLTDTTEGQQKLVQAISDIMTPDNMIIAYTDSYRLI